MQSWDGGALRCIKAQVWDALVLGLMDQGGDASQHSGEKRGKSPHPFFSGGRGVIFRYPCANGEPEPAQTSTVIQSIIYFGNTGRMGKSIQTSVKQKGTKPFKYGNSNGLCPLEGE